MKNKSDTIIPEQKEGFSTETTHSIDLITVSKARQLFEEAKGRLLDVTHWDMWSKGISSKFILANDKGEIVKRKARKGDYFKIDIPGPGPNAGGGYDWVRIEAFEEDQKIDIDSERFIMKVRPASSPRESDNDTAHFFQEDASSSFEVNRVGRKVTAGVHGRNEKPNIKTGDTGDNFRNAFIALGAVAGFSKIQWKNLVKGIVEYKGL